MSDLVLILKIFAVAVGSLVFFLVNLVVVLWLERKVMAHMQMRLGPMRTGWHGLLQPIADAIKLLTKEDIVPDRADKLLFALAPVITFVPSFFLYVSMPWVESWLGVELEVNLFLIFAISAIISVGLLVGGWASYNKYALLGAFRGAAQQISYEIPLLLSVVGVAMLAGSLSVSDVVDSQAGLPYAFLQPLAFLLYLIAMHAELNRTPFDMPEAESELVAGHTVEYSSIRFAVFFLAEYGNDFTFSLLGALLFLGGWNGPLLPGFVWLLLKAYLIVFVTLWSRATLPRVRVDQLMAFCWKVLLPFGLASMAMTAIGVFAESPWLLAAMQFAGVAALVWVVHRAAYLGEKHPGPIASERPGIGGPGETGTAPQEATS